MKTLSSVLLVVLTAAFAHAGTPLPVTDVPEVHGHQYPRSTSGCSGALGSNVR